MLSSSGGVFLQAHDAGACEHDFQAWQLVVASPQLRAPAGLLEHLVYEQGASALTVEVGGEVGNAASLKIEVVHVDVETFLVGHIEMFFRILQQESCLSYATGAFDADHAVVPVDLVHKGSTNRCVCVLHKVSMCFEESIHVLKEPVIFNYCIFLFSFYRAKGRH